VSVGFKFQLLPRMKGFIGEFAKLKKKKKDHELGHGRLSVRKELVTHWTDFDDT